MEENKFSLIFAVPDKASFEMISMEFLKISGIKIEGRADTREELMEVIKSKKDIDAVVITTDLPGQESFIKLSKEIPIEIRILAFDTARINELITGKMKENGVEFIENIEEIEKIIFQKENSDEEEDEESEEEPQEIQEEKENNIPKQKKKKINRGKLSKFNAPIKNVLNIKKQNRTKVIETPKTQMKEVVREIETTKRQLIEKIHIQKEFIIDPSYKKVVGVVGYSKTGKTFITASLLRELEKRKVPAAGIGNGSGLDRYFYSGMQKEKSLKKLLDEEDDPWLESQYLSIYSSSSKIELDAGNMLKTIEKIKHENTIIMFDFNASEDEKNIENIIECLILCDQIIYIIEPDPLTFRYQLELFKLISMYVNSYKMIFVINKYTKKGLGKCRIRKEISSLINQNIKEIYKLPICDKDIEIARMNIVKGKFTIDKLSKTTKKIISEIGEKIYPERVKESKWRLK